MLQPATVAPSGRAPEHGTLSRAALERDLREGAGRRHPRVRLCNASARKANRAVLPRAQVRGAHAEPQPAHGSGASEVPRVPGRAGGNSSVAILQGMSAELIGVFTEGVPLTGFLLTAGGIAIAAVRTVSPRLEDFEARTGALGYRQSRFEGWIEGSGLFRSLA